MKLSLGKALGTAAFLLLPACKSVNAVPSAAVKVTDPNLPEVVYMEDLHITDEVSYQDAFECDVEKLETIEGIAQKGIPFGIEVSDTERKRKLIEDMENHCEVAREEYDGTADGVRGVFESQLPPDIQSFIRANRSAFIAMCLIDAEPFPLEKFDPRIDEIKEEFDMSLDAVVGNFELHSNVDPKILLQQVVKIVEQGDTSDHTKVWLERYVNNNNDSRGADILFGLLSDFEKVRILYTQEVTIEKSREALRRAYQEALKHPSQISMMEFGISHTPTLEQAANEMNARGEEFKFTVVSNPACLDRK